MILIKKKLCVLIPAYNEESTIADSIKRIPSIPNLIKNVIVINDGSTDNTAKNSLNLGAMIITNPKNYGLGFSFKRGLDYAIKMNADVIVILDADGQYHPKDIKNLVKPILNGNADIVVGNRFQNINKDIAFLKGTANKMISIFVSKILLRLDEIYDIQSSFRAFNEKFALFLEQNIKAKYNYAQEMFILASKPPFRIAQIPVRCYQREYGKSKLIKNPLIHVVKIVFISVKSVLFLRFRLR